MARPSRWVCGQRGCSRCKPSAFHARSTYAFWRCWHSTGLPLQTSLEPNAIFEAMRNDKKRRAGRLRFVLPRAIGDVEFGVECQDRSVKAVLERLAHPPEIIRARR